MDREQVGHLHERHAGERRAHELRVFTPAGHRRPERVRCADHGGHEEDDPRDDLAHTGDPQRSRVVFLHEDLRHRAIDAPACAADEHACNADGHFPRRLLERRASALLCPTPPPRRARRAHQPARWPPTAPASHGVPPANSHCVCRGRAVDRCVQTPGLLPLISRTHSIAQAVKYRPRRRAPPEFRRAR